MESTDFRRHPMLAAILLLLLAGASGCGPAFLDNLASTAHRKRIRGHVFGDAGAGSDIGAIPHGYRRHQRGIAAHKSILADNRLVLVHAVVVAGDGPRAAVASRSEEHTS